MITNLYCANTPWSFWQCQPDPPEEVWLAAVRAALPILDISSSYPFDLALEHTLGEGRFGSDRWKLSASRRIYYNLKPLLPQRVIGLLKKLNSKNAIKKFLLNWPVEDRYARFLWEVMRQVLILTGHDTIKFRRFWPGESQFALILTHDIENQEGQQFVSQVADLEESLGFRSSFNFVTERYPVDNRLIASLRSRGFEIGIHGLKHDGKMFNSKELFCLHAARINDYLKSYQAVGFRSPMTHRNPEWMQALEIEYDLSFFDTDPFEPMPGGSMSIWPYFIGHFIELPYTLVQDSTLAFTLGEHTPKIWLDKIAFLRQYCGMALLNSHPDYLLQPALFSMYESFLNQVKRAGDYWNPLPREAAQWWRFRLMDQHDPDNPLFSYGTITTKNDSLLLS